MYVLVIYDKETTETRRFVSNRRKPLTEVLAMMIVKFGEDRLAHRWWRGAWEDGSEGAWEYIVDHQGMATIL